MTAQKPPKTGESSADRIQVEDAGRRRPFMRGILVHSLLARGVDFDAAYGTANTIRDRLRGREVIAKDDLRKAVRDLLGDEPFEDDDQLVLPESITVTGEGHDRPFSKGILSQSLLAAALDPNEAFDVAREIEVELVGRGSRQVDRSDLRQLTYDTLARRIGNGTANRYRAWRHFQEPERPVILLLGGATGVGKTSLALEVAHRLGIGRVLSTDSIRQIMRIMLSKDLVPAIHASSYDAYETLPPESLGEDPVIEGFRQQSATVSVGVRASMERAVAENSSLVLDGVSLLPGLIDIDAWREVADVFYLVVATLDEDSFQTRFATRGRDASQRPPHRYLEHLDQIHRVQDHFLELADRYDVPIVDNVSFDRSVLFIIRHVVEGLRKRGGIDEGEME